MTYRATVLADTPAGYWRLGEASGINAADETGNGKTGTYENAPTLGATGLLTGDANTAVTLNGSNQDILLPTDMISLAGPTSTISLEAWFKTSSGAGTILSARKSSNGNPLLNLSLSGNTILLQCRDNSGAGLLNATLGGGSLAIADGNRHHIVATRSAAGIWLIYIDGVLEDQKADTIANPITGMDWCYIGRDRAAATWLNGTVDEAAIYTSVLSATQVEQHWTDGSQEATAGGSDAYSALVIADGATTYYRLGEATGTIRAVDSIGGLHGGRRFGAPAGSQGLIAASTDTASTLDGTNDRIEIPPGILKLASATDSISIEAWIKISTGDIVAGRESTTNAILKMHAGSGVLNLQGRNNSGTGLINVAGVTGIVSNHLHHVVVTRDGSDKKWRLYVDGALDATSAADTLSSISNLFWSTIGFDRTGGTQCAGTVDEVAIYYGVALTLAQIQAHFNQARSVQPNFIPSLTVVHPPTLQSTQIDVPFIGSATVVYTPGLQGDLVIPFISSVTSVFTPALQGNIDVPFIGSGTAVFTPTLAHTEIDVPFIASQTRVFGVFSLFVDTMRSGVPGNGGEGFPVILAPNGSSVTATLDASITASTTLLELTGDSGLPDGGFIVQIDDEILYVVKITVGSYRIRKRGASNTTPASHTVGADVVWGDTYDMAIVAENDIAHDFTADILSSGSQTYPGWLICFDSTQAYLGSDRYPMHVTSVLGVFDAGTGSGGSNHCDAAQPNAVCTPVGASDDCPAALSNPSRIQTDILAGDVALVRYTNPEASELVLGERSAALNSWFGLKRVSTGDVDVTFADVNGIVVDTTGTYDTFTGSVNGEWHNPLGPGIGPDTGEPTDHDVPYTSVTLPGTDRNFTVTTEKGWPMGALAVRQGTRRVPFWRSFDWHDFNYVYSGFDLDATFCQLVVNRNGIVFGPLPEVALPGPQDITGPDAVWDDGSYYFGASWYVAIFAGSYLVIGPGIGGVAVPTDQPGGPPSAYVPSVSFGGGITLPTITVNPTIEGGSGGGINPPGLGQRFNADLV